MAKNKIILNIITLILLFVSLALILSYFWIKNFFGDYVDYNEIIFNLTAGINAVEGAPPMIFESFLLNVILKSLFFLGLIVFIFSFIKIYRLKISEFFKEFNLSKIFKIKNQLVLVGFFFIFSISYFLIKFQFYELANVADKYKVFFEKNYVSANDLNYNKPKKLKNLLVIFYESANKDFPFNLSAYKDGSVVENQDKEDVHSELRKISGYEIDDFVQAQSLGWTIAGMVASQCSVPLFTNKRYIEDINFLPKELICIGDILKKYGYQQSFFTSGEKEFHFYDKFYLNHGFSNIFGKTDYLLKGIENKYFGSWDQGLNDDILLKQVYEKILEERKKNKPFNITLLTLDTHIPYIYMSTNCENANKYNKIYKENYYLKLRESFKCTGKFIANFLKKLERDGILEDTLVVITGDHLAPIDEFSEPYLGSTDDKDPFKNKRIFFKVINSEFEPKRNLMSHYDIAPTILHDLNILDLNQDKFGFGVSLYSKMEPEDYLKKYIEVIKSNNLSQIFYKKIKSD